MEQNVETARWRDALARTVVEEQAVAFDEFTHDDAWTIGTHLVEVARARKLAVTIAVMFGEQRVFHAALGGTSAANDDWLDRKFRVVRKHDRSSYGVGCLFRSRGRDYDVGSRYDPHLYAAVGGAVPLRVRGALIGAVGVSGLAEEDDHAVVVEVLTEYARRKNSAKADVH